MPIWWQIILYGPLAVAAFYPLLAFGLWVAAGVIAARTPDPPTLADEIREARRARLRKAFPGLLPED